jgi:hypothetical protein
MILTGNRKPPLPLAIHIYRRTNWRHVSIIALTDEQIDALEAIERWAPRCGRNSAEDESSNHGVIHTLKAFRGSSGNAAEMSTGTNGGEA